MSWNWKDPNVREVVPDDQRLLTDPFEEVCLLWFEGDASIDDGQQVQQLFRQDGRPPTAVVVIEG